MRTFKNYFRSLTCQHNYLYAEYDFNREGKDYVPVVKVVTCDKCAHKKITF
jgi:hypothetical protein